VRTSVETSMNPQRRAETRRKEKQHPRAHLWGQLDGPDAKLHAPERLCDGLRASAESRTIPVKTPPHLARAASTR
jgi:hypothetical protein